MLSYAVLVAKPGCRVPPDRIALLAQEDLDDLHFVATDHVRWSSDDGSVHVGGWQASTHVFGIGSHWSLGQDRALTCFSGHAWPHGAMWPGGAAWADRLAEAFDDLPAFTTAGERLQGIFTAARVQPDGRGVLVTDPFSIGLLHVAETAEFVVLASHPRLAARLLAGPDRALARDVRTSGWLVFLGYVMGERTGFEGVRVLPLGASAQLDPRWGARIRVGANWTEPAVQGEDVFAVVHDALRASVSAVSQLPGERRRADLTGGFDSRLLLALALETGVQDAFEFTTTGAPFAPDVVVARRIADTFGLRHEVVAVAPMADEDFRRRLRTHVFQTAGMINGWDLKGALGVASVPRISGLYQPKSHYPSWDWPVASDEFLERFLHWSHTDTLSLLRPDVRHEYRRELVAAVSEQVDAAGLGPQDRVDSFYVRNRLRRWAGTEQSLENTARVYPLYVARALRGAFAIGPDQRLALRHYFEVMCRACPELARLPFADHGWPARLLADRPDGAEFAAPPVTHQGQRAVRWQGNRLDDNRDVVVEHLLDDPGNPVFDVLDRAAVERVLAGPSPGLTRDKQQLLGALTAAVWLGGHEHPDRFGAPPTPVAPIAVQPASSGRDTTSLRGGARRSVGAVRRRVARRPGGR